jgi:ribosomal protein S18 acetylase RimI-like enzyme
MALRVVSAGLERLDELEPLWAAMHSAHAAMADEVAPVRPLAESWRRRRAEYSHWLAAEPDDTRLLIAELDGHVVGYLMLRFMGGASTWDVGERVAEIESLSVLSDVRSQGVGARLVSAARELGTERLLVGAVHANTAALRFYEREGFGPFYVLLIERSTSERRA